MKADKNVDFITVCYERTYTELLKESRIVEILNQNRFKFSNVYVLINNVNDPAKAIKLARHLVSKKIITGYFFVKDYVEKALEIAEISKSELDKFGYFLDWALVEPLVVKSTYFMHWDCEINLRKPYDWISPCLLILQSSKSFFCANPAWTDNRKELKTYSILEKKDCFIGQHFSDQCYLINKHELLRPIYHYKDIFSLRFPLSTLFSIFEKRIDSYMRSSNRYRITYKHTTYTHPSSTIGANHPKASILQKIASGVLSPIGLFFRIYCELTHRDTL